MIALLFVLAQSLAVLPRESADPIAIAVENGPANTLDWVSLTPSIAPDGSYVDWFYLNGSKSAPSSGTTTAQVTFPVPTAGTYTVRMFANNTLAVKLATSPIITVGGSTPPITETIMFNGDSITAPYNITGAQNWTAIVASALGYTSVTNIAGNSKYAVDVLNEVTSMSGQVCMVMIGTNDMVGGVLSNVSADESRSAYLSVMRQLVTALTTRCARVVILTPPLSLSTREALRYPAWADGLRLICVEQGATFLNLFQHMADLSAIKSDSEVNGWYSDWRHLTVAGHAVIGEFVSQSLKVQP
jgi:lysophospholipase L1-like esterase